MFPGRKQIERALRERTEKVYVNCNLKNQIYLITPELQSEVPWFVKCIYEWMVCTLYNLLCNFHPLAAFFISIKPFLRYLLWDYHRGFWLSRLVNARRNLRRKTAINSRCHYAITSFSRIELNIILAPWWKDLINRKAWMQKCEMMRRIPYIVVNKMNLVHWL